MVAQEGLAAGNIGTKDTNKRLDKSREKLSVVDQMSGIGEYTTLHYTTLHYTTLHYSTLHYTTLHYTILDYNTLHEGDTIVTYTIVGPRCQSQVFRC